MNMRTICLCFVTVFLLIQTTVGLPSSGAVSFVRNEVSNVIGTVEKDFTTIKHEVSNFVSGGCNCEKYTCGCCSHLELDDIHLNSTICSNVTYLNEDYGISFTVTVDDYTLFNETVSARNPPPVCIIAPYVEKLASACVRLYDIQTTRRSLHACARVEARMKGILLAKYDLGCFNIGNNTLVTEESEVPMVYMV